MAEAAPITPKNGEYIGASSVALIVARLSGFGGQIGRGRIYRLPIVERRAILTSPTSLN
ncbi:hypothetical protein X777_11781 [Ooceraea biroi]|uniref:Uncharacterized protein n=1 Tax=Ooceraea biroi TaxID=2015173 RepID=A0A026W0U8_OOCBI|nr:hypothetical protein X777_11781 [Ooceraea biroi]